MSISSRATMRSSCLSLAVLAVLSSPLTAAAGDPPADDADPQVTTLGKVEVRADKDAVEAERALTPGGAKRSAMRMRCGAALTPVGIR